MCYSSVKQMTELRPLSLSIYIYIYIYIKYLYKNQLSPILCNPWTVAHQAPLSMGFSWHEYWSGFSFSRGFSQPRDWTQVSCIAGRFFTVWAAREAQDIRMVLRNEMNSLALAPALMVFCFLLCDCRGGAAHAWSLPATVSKENQRQKLSITKSACGRNGKRFCSTLTLYAAQANHTGFYSCKYLSTSASKKKGESTIYIFINGKSFISHILFSVAV